MKLFCQCSNRFYTTILWSMFLSSFVIFYFFTVRFNLFDFTYSFTVDGISSVSPSIRWVSIEFTYQNAKFYTILLCYSYVFFCCFYVRPKEPNQQNKTFWNEIKSSHELTIRCKHTHQNHHQQPASVVPP